MFMLKDRLNYMTSVNDDRYADAPHVKGNFEVVEIDLEHVFVERMHRGEPTR